MALAGSYIDAVEAQTYFDGRLNSQAWDLETDADTRNKSLITATRIIDQLNYLGSKADDAQTLQFPRGSDASIPEAVKNATAEIALALLDGVDPELEFENLFMTSQGYGGIRSSYDRRVKSPHVLVGVPSFMAWKFLRPFLRDPLNVEIHRTS